MSFSIFFGAPRLCSSFDVDRERAVWKITRAVFSHSVKRKEDSSSAEKQVKRQFTLSFQILRFAKATTAIQ